MRWELSELWSGSTCLILLKGPKLRYPIILDHNVNMAIWFYGFLLCVYVTGSHDSKVERSSVMLMLLNSSLSVLFNEHLKRKK